MFNRGTTGGLFGGGGNTTFGASAFGAAAATPFSGGTTGGFGTTGFGATATPAGTTGLFGASTAAPASGGLFGQAAAKPNAFSFGAQNVATVQPTTGLFGSAATTGFGGVAAPAQQTTPFGGSLFGAGASAVGPVGTTVKFAAVTGTDIMMKNNQQQSVTTKLQCITGMKEYESKSLEELRLEDYAANRKGPQPGSMGFASAAQPSQGFGFGGFGGTSTSSVFGQPQSQQSQPGGLFGATTAKPLFTGTAAPTSSLFGNPAQNPFSAAKPNLFGTTTTTQSGGLFGSTQQAGGLFGATQPAANTGSIFGAATASTGSAFGTPAASVAPFGTANQSAGGLFGQAARPTGGLFGQTAATTQSAFGSAFGGAPAAAQPTLGSAGFFGAKSAAPTSAFNFSTPATNTGFGSFGAANTGLGAQSAFGTGLNTGSGMFGQQNKPALPTLGFGGNTASAFSGGTGFGSILGGGTAITNTVAAGTQDAAAAAVAQQQQLLQQQVSILNSSPYGDSPLFRNLRQSDGVSRRDSLLKPTNPAAQKAALEAGQQFKVQTRMTAKVKPTPVYSAVSGKGQLFDGLEDDDVSYDTSVNTSRRSVKKLVIKSAGSHNHSVSSQFNQSVDQPLNISTDTDYLGRGSSGLNLRGGGGVVNGNGLIDRGSVNQLGVISSGVNTGGGTQQSYHNGGELDNTVGELNGRGGGLGGARADELRQGAYPQRGRSSEIRGRSFSFEEDNSSEVSSDDFIHRQNDRPHKAGIVLRRPGYYTVPSLDELEGMVDADGHCLVDNFVIGRENYGSVSFPGVLDVSGLNIDELVHFRSKEIDIYPSEERKPAVGEGLNRPAQVTLDRVWPVDKNTGETIRDYDRLMAMHYMEKLERASYKIGAKFIEYRPETGSWVFEVRHFSKYRLPDDLDEDDDESLPAEVRLKRLQQALEHKSKQQNVEDSGEVEGSDVVARGDQLVDSLSAGVGLGGRGILKGLAAPMFDDTDSYMMEDVSRVRFNIDGDLSFEKLQKKGVSMEEELDLENEELDKRDYMERTLGASAYQVQLQKASFFGQFTDDDVEKDSDDDDISLLKKNRGIKADVRSGVIGFLKSSPNTFLVDSSLKKDRSLASLDRASTKSADLFNKTHSGALEGLIESGKSTPRPSSRLDLPSLPTDSYPLVPSGLSLHLTAGSLTGCRVSKALQPFDRSLLAGRQGFYMDAGLVQGRKFRVGWAVNWRLSQIGHSADKDAQREEDLTPYSDISLMRRSAVQKRKSMLPLSGSEHKITDWKNVALSNVEVANTDQDLVMLKECLLLALSNSEWIAGAGGPVFNPRPGLDLLNSYNSALSQHPAAIGYSLILTNVWSLCKALWGELDSVEADCGDYILQLGRREALSNWLTETSKDSIYTEVKHNIDKGRDSSCSVFSYLTGRLVSEACECAEGSRDLRLALLVAQASSCEDFRQLLWQQLAAWADVQMDQFIDMERLKIVALLAGLMEWQTSSGKLNVCEGLDWKRCLAIHLWYKCSANANIDEALQQYEKACNLIQDDGKHYAVPPSPQYLESVGLSERRVYDVTYHLLKLYTDRSHPLNLLLNPSTMTGNQLDYSLSWHLMCVLESLGYTHISQEHHTYICNSYAAQLEAVGLYDWAAFVLLHIRNINTRKEAVTQLLTRHVNTGGSETEEEEEKLKFVVEQLHIPPQWIHIAKSIRAHYQGDVNQEAWHLLKAEEWNKCHDVVVNSIASDAVVNDEQSLLELYLTPLSDVSHIIKDWSHGGLVYLDYYMLKTKFQQFKESEESDEMAIDELRCLSSSLSDRLTRLPTITTADRVSHCKLARCIADVVSLLTSIGAQNVRQSTVQLDGLQLSQDDHLTALSHMSQLLMVNIASSY